jgi:putative hemolysin
MGGESKRKKKANKQSCPRYEGQKFNSLHLQFTLTRRLLAGPVGSKFTVQVGRNGCYCTRADGDIIDYRTPRKTCSDAGYEAWARKQTSCKTCLFCYEPASQYRATGNNTRLESLISAGGKSKWIFAHYRVVPYVSIEICSASKSDRVFA